jgi:hypothetical protein
MIDYNGFKTQAFIGWGIPPQLLDSVQPWVETNDEHVEYITRWHYQPDSESVRNSASSLGYGELISITTVDQGMQELKQAVEEAMHESQLLKNKAYKRLLADPGKYLQRVVLKTYWLSRAL